MSTTETDMLVKPQKVTYFSRHENFRIKRVDPVERILHTGKLVVDVDPVAYQFKNGFLEVEPDQDMLPTGRGDALESAVEWLERQDSFGSRFFRQDAPAPDASAVFLEVNRLGLLGKVDELKELLEVERANWDRAPVLAAIEESLGLLEEPPPAA